MSVITNISPWPQFSEDEQSSVIDVLKSGKVNYWSGEFTKKFEEEFSAFLGKGFKSVACANGSVALYMAYLSLGLEEGDEVITTPRTFIATSSELMRIKVKPIFADVDKDSGCITPATIEPLISKKTKAISVVHLGGWPADMEGIMSLAKSYDLKVIEDCSQAHGAEINGFPVGTFGDISTWSFCTDKIISTGGEGGMVSTRSQELYEFVWSLKDHGKTIYSMFEKSHPFGFRFVHEKLGTNFRLTELQSAIGRIQLSKLSEFTEKRTRNALILLNKLSDIEYLRIPFPNKNIVHAWYKFYCFLEKDKISHFWSRDRIIKEINNMGYPAFHGGCGEIYLEKCFTNSKSKETKKLPIAHDLFETSLMFLVHPTITLSEMESYSSCIKDVLIKASK